MKNNKTSPKRIFFFLLFLVFIWIAVVYFAKTEEILRVLSSGKWYWIILAVIVQLVYYPIYAVFIERAFNIFRINLKAKEILPVYVASKFTDVALPIATLGEVAIFIRNGKKHQLNPLNVGIGITFAMYLEVVAFAIVAFAAIILLLAFGKPVFYLLATLLLLTVVILIVVLFLLRLAHKQPLHPFFLWLIKTVLHLTGQKMDMEQIDQIFQEVGSDLRTGRGKIAPTLKTIVFLHLVNFITFALVFLAFAGHFNLFAILAGFIAGFLFTIISITPQGVGVAETVMIATMHALGIDLSVAAVITLAFRGLLYWLPLFAGFYFFSHLELKSDPIN